MKTLIGLTFWLLAAPLFAQNADELRAMSMKGCDIRVESLADEQRQRKLEICKCTVSSTDYDALYFATRSGVLDFQKTQAESKVILKKCIAAQDPKKEK